MFLNAIAQKHLHEQFDAWDSVTKTFVPRGFKGRLDLTDRFLSIYNRPTRKRQLYVKPDEVLPQSLVFRHPSSGDVYIIGQERQDARFDVTDGDTYIKMAMVHLVTPKIDGSSGLAVQTRKVPKGPADNPGWLVDEVLAEDFLDVEFRTNTAETGVYDNKVGNFYAWTTLNVEARQYDFFLLNGKNYRVVDSFPDLGMRGLRLDQEGDPRINLVITSITSGYDPVEHEYTDVEANFNVTAVIPEYNELAGWADNKISSSVTVVIDFNHIGFEPKPNMKVTYKGRTRLVKSVDSQAGEKQYRLLCE